MQKFFSLLVKWPIFMGDKIEEKPQWNLSFGTRKWFQINRIIVFNLHLQGRRENKAAFQGKLPV